VSFLDNLENTLKALERQEERDPDAVRKAQARRTAERDAALARAPHLEALRNSPFITAFLGQCRLVGREQRVLVQFTWVGETLRLDAKTQRLDLVPEADGVHGIASDNGQEEWRAVIDFASQDPDALARRWLTRELPEDSSKGNA
jgi:hypothetical protein